jgi:hypothetical protein
LDYIVHISRGPDNVGSTTVKADSDVQACDMAKAWATSLNLALDDDVVLAVKLPSGKFRTFAGEDF